MNCEIDSQNSFLRWQGSQRRIGITGGIATGKSTIGKFLQEKKSLPILDADIYAKEALAPDRELTAKVIEHFGKTITNQPNGKRVQINRSALGEIIFTDDKERVWLEELMHPIIRQRLLVEIEQYKNAPTLGLIIPLLFEAQFTTLCSEIWLVVCSQKQQFERLIMRDNLSRYEAQQRIQSQWPLEIKKQYSEFIIDNSGKTNEWEQQIENIL